MTGRKVLLVLVLVVFAAGWSFAQTDSDRSPNNTITIDIGPTIVGAAIGGIGNAIGEPGVSSSGFGIAAQYERQIMEKLSVAGRFAYLGGGIGFADETVEQGVKVKTVASINLSSFSLESHVRFYPGDTFFLDGMLGYANLTTNASGEFNVNVEGHREKETASLKATRSYLKLGAKIGWRIDFGKPGGFIFEPSFGYYGGIGLGDTLGKRLSKEIGGEISELDPIFVILEQVVFVGGPRLALSFGWKF